MLDGVLEIASQVAKELDIATVRFNFRGVGASAGSHDNGMGEINDLAAITEAFQAEFDELRIGGYSFGAQVALRYAERHTIAKSLVLVAPPTHNPLPNLDAHVDLIAGEFDAISSVSILKAWVAQRDSRTLHMIHGADHFVSAHGTELKAILRKVLPSSH